MEEKSVTTPENISVGEKETVQEIKDTQPIQEIISTLELLLKSDHITSTQKQFKELISKWEKEDENSLSPSPEQKEAFEKAREQYQKNYDWALWANYKIKEEICKELEGILDADKQQLFERFEILKKKWKETGNVPQEKSQDLWQRYKKLGKEIQTRTQSLLQENLEKKIALCEKIENIQEVRNWQKATDFVKNAQQNWNLIGPIQHKESEKIWKRFQSACNTFFTRQKEHYRELKKEQKNNLQLKKELCVQVETIAESNQWKETSSQIHDLQQEWKKIGSAGKKHEAIVWKRFKTACDTFFSRQKDHFNQIDEERPINQKLKEALCEKLENMTALSDSEKYKLIIDTQKEWKKIGPVPKENEKSLWQKFRKPIDAYFESRKQKYEVEKEHYEENIQQKEEFCREAEKLQDSDNWQETKERLKHLQKEWNTIGNIPPAKEKEIRNRFKKACDIFFNRYKNHRDDKKQELQENLHKKTDLCFQVEIIAGVEVNPQQADARAKWQLEKLSENFWFKIVEDEAWDTKADKIKELQKEWKKIGPVPKNKSQELWERFQNACNHFFENKRSHSTN